MKGEGQRNTPVPVGMAPAQLGSCWGGGFLSPPSVLLSQRQSSTRRALGTQLPPPPALNSVPSFCPQALVPGGQVQPRDHRTRPAAAPLAWLVLGWPSPARAFALVRFGFFLSGSCDGKEVFP